MRALRRKVDSTIALATVFTGAWTIHAQLGIVAGFSFATIRNLALLPVVASVALLVRARWFVHDDATEPAEFGDVVGRRTLLIWIAGAAIISLAHAIIGSDWVFWAGAVLLLGHGLTFNRQITRRPLSAYDSGGRAETVVLFGLCLIAMILTAGVNRPDPDDAYFLNAAVAAMEFPAVTPQEFDAMHRDGLPPVEQMLHLPETYSLLVALLAFLFRTSAETMYYVVLPPLWAALGTLVTWATLRYLLPARAASWGAGAFVFLMFFWGDGHRTFGNFGFVRIFQGKAIYVTVFLPLLVLLALRFRDRPDWRSWSLLALAQCAAAGLTVNGVVVAPLAAGLALVALPRIDRDWLRVTAAGVAASLPLIVLTVLLAFRMAPWLGATDLAPAMLGYGTLGSTRVPLILFALMIIPLLAMLARARHTGWLAWYVWLVVLVMFMPATSEIAAMVLGPVYSWRLLWAVPIPLLLSLAVALSISGATGRSGKPAMAVIVVWLVAFALVDVPAVTRQIFSPSNALRPKVDRLRHALARDIAVSADRETPALVPERVAVYMTGAAGAPPLVGVRELYLSKLPGFIPDSEVSDRTLLFRYVSDRDPAMSADGALASIERRRVSTVVFPENHRDAGLLTTALVSGGGGFTVRNRDGFVIAERRR
ncbi:MAG: DUF6077 domain-containing protein [Gemmatimonadota bacterium]